MIDCQKASFSSSLQQQRLEQARSVLGGRVVDRLLCFSLFLLGFRRNTIAELLDTPPGTVRSVVRSVVQDGLPALEDRRSSSSAFLPSHKEPVKITIGESPEMLIVNLGDSGRIEIPRENILQQRVVLLSLLTDKLLSTREVSEALGLSMVHTRELSEKLSAGDVSSLIDKRSGQIQEYRFTPEVKAQLIEQFVVDLITDGRVSGKKMAEHLRQRCDVELSERSIRDHLGKLGLARIKKSLPGLLKEAKKNS